MKKLVLTTLALAVGGSLAFSQGIVDIVNNSAGITTNNLSGGTGIAGGTSGSWDYEVLDLTSTAYAALSASQQTNLTTMTAGVLSEFDLWTDSTVSGANTSLHAGGINGAASATAANWAAPATGNSYGQGAGYDYYAIIGWSANEGSWLTVSNVLAGASTWAVSGAGNYGFFGVSSVVYNYAGNGGSAPSVSLWGTSAATGLAGSGGLTTFSLNSIVVPEPTTLALAGLGGLSMLFLRRRKS